MATEVLHEGDGGHDAVSPRNKSSIEQTIERSLGALSKTLESRADPDAQTTVTDFLDFAEYLPSDMVRSLTLIGKLDQTYEDSSARVDELTTLWGQLPTLPADERPVPAQLRADISEQLNQAVSTRVFAHAEAVRMAENVNRHYNKAKIVLAKLQTMMENYPTEEQRSPTLSKSPQLLRSNAAAARAAGDGAQRVRRQKVPKITVPGEVLAPYDLEYDTFTDESDISSDSDSDIPAAGRRTPAPPPKARPANSGSGNINTNSSNKTPKSSSRSSRPANQTPAALSAAAAANAAALLQPPPENAVIGSPDAPWLQLTQYELAKLRKRMKKNATWTPSETMIARELKALGRGPDAYREAKKKAEDEGKVFEPTVPAPVVDDDTGAQHLPAGAISVDSLAADDVPTSNRGMKLNEAKKLKREALAKLAAEEAEASARKMAEAAKLFLGSRAANASDNGKGNNNGSKAKPNPRPNPKRKRENETEASTETAEVTEPSPARPQYKRTKTETPVPPPQQLSLAHNMPTPDPSQPPPLLTPGGTVVAPHAETPVPIPIPPQGSSRSAMSPTPNPSTITTSVPVKPPSETPVPIPIPEGRKSTTPIAPPVPGRETTKRETRGDAAKRTQQQQQPAAAPVPTPQASVETVLRQSSSRGPTPRTTPAPEASAGRRPGSRGKAMSQEPQPSSASDRPRRASTARNTPAPDVRPPGKRTKRPAPGIVSTTSSGGNSAIGKRKAAPRKKARATRKEKGQITELEMEEVDDEGNPIDPDEPRYCLCNRVSFGTMIQCDNVDVSTTSDDFFSCTIVCFANSRHRFASKSGFTWNASVCQIYQHGQQSGIVPTAAKCSTWGRRAK
ncbi:hypothetical protein HJFPF1_02801 [Paramyrothecium foliicola]|nr:hypothetical protein HJFPF1_02801 [Paramyrothecium foliicola]